MPFLTSRLHIWEESVFRSWFALAVLSGECQDLRVDKARKEQLHSSSEAIFLTWSCSRFQMIRVVCNCATLRCSDYLPPSINRARFLAGSLRCCGLPCAVCIRNRKLCCIASHLLPMRRAEGRKANEGQVAGSSTARATSLPPLYGTTCTQCSLLEGSSQGCVETGKAMLNGHCMAYTRDGLQLRQSVDCLLGAEVLPYGKFC